MSNPRLGVALTKCFYCGEGDRILLNRVLTEHMAQKVERAHNCVLDMEPCEKCKGWMQQGIILITIDSAKSDPNWNKPPTTESSDYWRVRPSQRRAFIPNPYRTGGFFVIKDEAFKRIFDGEEIMAFGLKHRWMFIEHEAAERIGLLQQAKEET